MYLLSNAYYLFYALTDLPVYCYTHVAFEYSKLPAKELNELISGHTSTHCEPIF